MVLIKRNEGPMTTPGKKSKPKGLVNSIIGEIEEKRWEWEKKIKERKRKRERIKAKLIKTNDETWIGIQIKRFN